MEQEPFSMNYNQMFKPLRTILVWGFEEVGEGFVSTILFKDKNVYPKDVERSIKHAAEIRGLPKSSDCVEVNYVLYERVEKWGSLELAKNQPDPIEPVGYDLDTARSLDKNQISEIAFYAGEYGCVRKVEVGGVGLGLVNLDAVLMKVYEDLQVEDGIRVLRLYDAKLDEFCIRDRDQRGSDFLKDYVTNFRFVGFVDKPF